MREALDHCERHQRAQTTSTHHQRNSVRPGSIHRSAQHSDGFKKRRAKSKNMADQNQTKTRQNVNETKNKSGQIKNIKVRSKRSSQNKSSHAERGIHGRSGEADSEIRNKINHTIDCYGGRGCFFVAEDVTGSTAADGSGGSSQPRCIRNCCGMTVSALPGEVLVCGKLRCGLSALI